MLNTLIYTLAPHHRTLFFLLIRKCAFHTARTVLQYDFYIVKTHL